MVVHTIMTNCKCQTTTNECKLCRSKDFVLVKRGNIDSTLSAGHFSVTDYRYGQTGSIFKCLRCNLLQCLEIIDPLAFYEMLEDYEYEEGKVVRSLQMEHILKLIRKIKSSGRLLDIGAASGILVSLALKAGYSAEGIEPSKSFCNLALKQNLPVRLGTFPNKNVKGPFDIITLIDVLEHVAEPVLLLKEISKALADDGIGILVTPDVSSVAARIIGWKWWHFRVAHITYFNRQTLRFALSRAGLTPVFLKRAKWYFTVGYLLKRLAIYVPQFIINICPKRLYETVVPLNLFDSMLVVFKKRKTS